VPPSTAYPILEWRNLRATSLAHQGETSDPRSAAKMLVEDEARQIAANVATVIRGI
jgi:hypothetical protein